jgi:hypothetical protein
LALSTNALLVPATILDARTAEMKPRRVHAAWRPATAARRPLHFVLQKLHSLLSQI